MSGIEILLFRQAGAIVGVVLADDRDDAIGKQNFVP
jgi:hypothetical protein